MMYSSPQKHKNHLREVFQRLSEYGILINPLKCQLGVNNLGHRVSSEGIRPLESNVDVVQRFPTPTTVGMSGHAHALSAEVSVNIA